MTMTLKRHDISLFLLWVLLSGAALSGCAALQQSRTPADEATDQTQKIVGAENQQELEQLVQENSDLRESLKSLNKRLEELNSRL